MRKKGEMMKKRLLLLIGVSTLFLGACDSVKSGDMRSDIDTIAQQINYIQANEQTLQKDFEADIASNPELETMGKENARVSKNLNERLDAADKISENLDALKEDTEQVESQNSMFKSTSRDTIRAIETYLKSYRELMNEENKYYQSLAGDKATAATFEDTIDDLNFKHKETQEQLNKLQKKIDHLREAITREEEANNE